MVAANLEDFDPEAETLQIFGKGKGNQAETVSLGKGMVRAIAARPALRGENDPRLALFCSVYPGYRSGRLSTQGIYNAVRECGRDAGINRVMSHHHVQHSSINASLDATNGDVRKVQKLSKHDKLNILMIDDNNRQKVTDLRDKLLGFCTTMIIVYESGKKIGAVDFGHRPRAQPVPKIPETSKFDRWGNPTKFVGGVFYCSVCLSNFGSLPSRARVPAKTPEIGNRS